MDIITEETEACIFDLDGVIVDTARFHFKSWKRLADSLEIPFTRDDNERLKGVSRSDSLDIILSLGDNSISDEKKQELMDRKNEWYREYISHMTPNDILEGVTEFLVFLKRNNVKMAIGSSSRNTPLILDRIDLGDYFEAVIDGNKISKSKPHPEVFLNGAEAMELKPEQCVVFEDATAGVEAAHAGGMKCIGVGSPEILSDADVVISSFKDDKIHELKSSFSSVMSH